MSEHRESPSSGPSAPLDPTRKPAGDATAQRLKEIGGPKGLEPTRYGDWEKAGRCIDF